MEFPSDFLHTNNTAGQTLLKLVSRGSSILAEMLRLSDHIPGVFTGQDAREQARYKDIIFDFEYLNKQEQLDTQIEKSEVLLDLDDTFRENHIDILQRFFELFESIVRYHRDLLSFVSQVKDGAFLQYSLESLLTDTDGVQLISEGIYLYGVMLLLLDLKIAGHVREKIVMMYYRYKPSLVESSIRDVVKLCRSTGMIGWNAKRPKSYPENYFGRFIYAVIIFIFFENGGGRGKKSVSFFFWKFILK
ncbi:hypothetical protein RFI_07339 [Reticulomyxa filosa]|uniref:CYRIA/CYRIB Rac1 binding domain-containing protein n=1 Tax=Reticulomyxa filosa TaxID=46433 RepID=X6NUT8_RETFI|nr:hypothetical protein RFI_07339 [Reticulomyxa filosa]|eukprot:ETO29781.1 hypothetical protein RFI_07339 [Reticulomyxa filosa]